MVINLSYYSTYSLKSVEPLPFSFPQCMQLSRVDLVERLELSATTSSHEFKLQREIK